MYHASDSTLPCTSDRALTHSSCEWAVTYAQRSVDVHIAGAAVDANCMNLGCSACQEEFVPGETYELVFVVETTDCAGGEHPVFGDRHAVMIQM
eukprot:scaffold103591_cov13-Prasinocladus_malaysianus.AAC.1